MMVLNNMYSLFDDDNFFSDIEKAIKENNYAALYILKPDENAFDVFKRMLADGHITVSVEDNEKLKRVYANKKFINTCLLYTSDAADE